MKKHKLLFLLFILFVATKSYSQENPVIIDYINTYKELAISEMKRTGVPAAIKLAQGIHETEAGTSKLVKKSNNHFGIKCKSDWVGMRVRHTDDAPNECFRSYNDSEDSYKDHSDFLKNSKRYASLFDLDPTDFEGWAQGLKKAGYATNPKYPQILIKIIEDYHLQDYTLIALGDMSPGDEFWVKKELVLPEDKSTDGIPDIIVEEIPVVMKPEPLIVLAATKKAKPDTKTAVPDPVVADVKTEYPEGEFKINETKVIYAKKGTSFLSIAEKYNLPLARLFEFNDMKTEEFVKNDQLLYLMRKRKTGNNEQYTVREGDSLYSIAQTEAIRIESILEYNYLKQGMMPAIGTVLYLKGKAPLTSANGIGK